MFMVTVAAIDSCDTVAAIYSCNTVTAIHSCDSDHAAGRDCEMSDPLPGQIAWTLP